MLPETLLSYRADLTTAVLSAKHDDSFYLLGFSGNASARPCSETITSVMLRPRPQSTEQVPDIAAINVNTGNGRNSKNFGFLLPVWNGEHGVEVDLKKIHVPKGVVQMYIYYLHAIGEVDGVQTVVTTQTIPSLVKEDEHWISNPNLLCGYAAGIKTFEELLAEAQQQQREKDEIEKLTRENADLTAELERHRASIANVSADLHYVQDLLVKTRGLWSNLQLQFGAAEQCIGECQRVAAMHFLARSENIEHLLFVTKWWKLSEIKRLSAKYFLKPNAS